MCANRSRISRCSASSNTGHGDGRTCPPPRGSSTVGSADDPIDAKNAIGTATAGSWRCAALPGWISMRGWSQRAGPSPTGGTRMHTLPRSRRHVRQGAACAAGKSFRLGWGDTDNGSARERGTVQHQGQHQQERHANLPRAGRATTARPESTRRRGSGGSAPRTRRGRRDGGARGNSPHPHGAAHQRRLRMPPEVGRGGRCCRNTGSALELRSGVGDARLQGKRRRPRWPSDRSEARCRRIGPARGGIVSEAQRGPGAGPPVAIQSVLEFLRYGRDENKRDSITMG